MRFGAHVSIAGGIWNAPKNAHTLGCDVFQMFSRSPQGGPAPKLTDEILAQFHDTCKEYGFDTWVIHAPYYINFASHSEKIRKNTGRIIREELERGTKLRAKYVMFHPGSAREVSPEQGMQLCIDGIRDVLDGYSGTTELLIEISAGAGNVLGDTFEEVATMIEGVGNPDLGVCFDTQHAFASGYDLRTANAVKKTFQEFDTTIGLSKLKMSHLNDSKVPLGANRDRHEHIGAGEIGAEGFRALFAHPSLQSIDWYLETKPDGVPDDLKRIQDLI
ncbi:MAG: deoxyribonuclease IV [bacterium]|nr:deoxyribonuclease IV [bacterium]